MSPVQRTYTTLPADSGRLLVLFTRTGLTFGLQRVEKNGIEKMEREEAQCAAREHCNVFSLLSCTTLLEHDNKHNQYIGICMLLEIGKELQTNKRMRAVHYNLATLPHTMLPDVSTPAQ